MATTRIFIDSRVNDQDLLISQFTSDTEYSVLDASRDGIEQMASALSGPGVYDSIQILSYGAIGSIFIGSTVLDSSSLNLYAAELAQIGRALTENGDLLLYGSSVASGDQGLQFIDTLSHIIGADVAASDDLSGGTAAGGDWALEVQSGAVEQDLTLHALNDSYLLANSIPTVTGPLATTVAEGDPSVSLNLQENAHDADLTDMLSVGWVSYTVNGVPSVLPSGITMNGSLLTIDPANTAYEAMAQGEQTTIVATYQVLDRAAVAEISFATKVDYATGSYPTSVISADVDGDSKLDLIVANNGSNTVSVLKNNGDGTFATEVEYLTGYYSVSVASVDVTGDSKLDLIVANDASNTVSVLENNGDGTFATKVDYVTGDYPIAVTSADVTGDGKLDLIVANSGSDTVSVLKNQGDGTFATKVDYATGSTPFSVTSADVNGDGKLDLIVADLYSDTVSVLKNNGDGTFAIKVDYATGSYPTSVTSADVNGDSKIDLMVTNSGSDTVSVLKNNGDGTFATRVDYAAGSAWAVTSVDVNGDGKLELIVANFNSDTVSVLSNNGDGAFASKVDYATGAEPCSVTSADVNSDGKLDLIVANEYSDTVSVLLNNSTGFCGGYPTTTETITIHGANDAPVMDATDVTGAVTDLVTPIGNLTDSGTINFTDVDLADSHSISSVSPSPGALGTLTPTITADTTGTGHGGVVTWNYSVEAAAVEYLAEGEHKVETFTFSLLDGHGGSVERTVDVTITGTTDVQFVDLTGAVTFWKTGAPIAGVTSTLTTVPADPGTQGVEFRNIQIAADGTRTIEIWETSANDLNSFQLEFALPTGSIATWRDEASLSAGWSLLVNTGISGEFLLGGVGLTSLPAGTVKLGTLTLTAPANPLHFELALSKGDLGDNAIAPCGIASDSMITALDGLYQHFDMPDDSYALTSAKVAGTAEGNAIKANDALAALKIAAGMNPNSGGSAISPYQYLAADVNKDGQVKAGDALNILKLAIKLDTAPEKEWQFVPESVASESMSRTHVVWPDNPIPVSLHVDQDVHLIGIVMGDVNGSWVA